MAAEAFGYTDAVHALSEALTFGINPSLETITAMTEELGRPQDSFSAIQVTGTNGKSSVTRLIAAILDAHGVKTGSFTSPDLHSYTERIACADVPVSESMFAAGISEAIEAARSAGVTPTEFELLTAAALWLFRECGVDVAVLEVGMGGRWDATSVVDPLVAVITGIALDHTAQLGASREDIAADKAHIIKATSAVVLGPGTTGVERIFQSRAQEVGAAGPMCAIRHGLAASPFGESDTVRYALTRALAAPDGASRIDVRASRGSYSGVEVHGPAYQAGNAATAIAAVEAYRGRALDVAAVRTAVASVTVPGRFQVVARDPWVLVDAAHNGEAAGELARGITAAWPDPEARPTVVLGVLADKDAASIVASLSSVVSGFVCVAPDSPRALAAADLADVVERVTEEPPDLADSVEAGIEAARAANPAGVVVTGSIRTVADATAGMR